MTINKLSSSACLLIAALTTTWILAADNNVILGKWTSAFNAQGRSTNLVLTIRAGEDGLLEGTWEGGREGATEISDVSFDGETLEFSRTTRRGNTIQSLKLEEDTLRGSMSTRQGETPLTFRKDS